MAMHYSFVFFPAWFSIIFLILSMRREGSWHERGTRKRERTGDEVVWRLASRKKWLVQQYESVSIGTRTVIVTMTIRGVIQGKSVSSLLLERSIRLPCIEWR